MNKRICSPVGVVYNTKVCSVLDQFKSELRTLHQMKLELTAISKSCVSQAQDAVDDKQRAMLVIRQHFTQLLQRLDEGKFSQQSTLADESEALLKYQVALVDANNKENEAHDTATAITNSIKAIDGILRLCIN